MCEETARAMNSVPFVSIIVPVYNDLERLDLCLQALSGQTYPATRYEIIVVDNRSEVDIKSITSRYPKVKYLREDKPGSYAARNAGIRGSCGTLLGFTDADCIPADTWIECGVNRVEGTTNCGLVGGKIVLTFRENEHPTIPELYDRYFTFKQDRYVLESHYAATANLFTTADVVRKVGAFDETFKSAGDREWGRRVWRHGYKLIYAEEVRIHHPARRTFAEHYRRAIRSGGGLYTLDKTQSPGTRSVRDWIRMATPPLKRIGLIVSDKEIPSLQARVGIAGMTTAIKYILFWEQLRVALGGKPRCY